MCYSPNVSLFAFVVAIASSSVLLLWDPVSPAIRAIAVALAFVSIMQVFDYLFWTHAAWARRPALNAALTKLAMLANHAQPLVLFAVLHHWLGRSEANTDSNIARILLATYTVAAVVYTAVAWPRLTGTFVRPETNGSLYWEWNYMPGSRLLYVLYTAAIVSTLMAYLPRPLGYATSGFAVASVIFATLWYKGRVSGRMWCWIAALFPAVLLLATIAAFLRLCTIA